MSFNFGSSIRSESIEGENMEFVDFASLRRGPALGPSPTIRANKGIRVDISTEQKILRALELFVWQAQIFRDIVAHRERRMSSVGYLELNQHVPIRPRTDFSSYFDRLAKCRT